jgi:branched-chain amino acid transport system substrate-binding protein
MKALDRSRRQVLIGIGLISLAGSVVPFREAVAAETFKIGLIADYSGAFATWGPQFQNAIEAYQAIYGKSVNGPKGEDRRAVPLP